MARTITYTGGCFPSYLPWSVCPEIIRAGGGAPPTAPAGAAHVACLRRRQPGEGKSGLARAEASARRRYGDIFKQEHWQREGRRAIRQAMVQHAGRFAGPAGRNAGGARPGCGRAAVARGRSAKGWGAIQSQEDIVFTRMMGRHDRLAGVTVVDDGTLADRRGSLTIDDEGTTTCAMC